MIKKSIEITRLYFVTTYQERSVLIFTVLLPLLFTFLIGQAIGGGSDGPTRWALAVVDGDNAVVSQSLTDRLNTEPTLDVHLMDRTAALTALEDGHVVAMVSIPNGFSNDLLEGRPVELAFTPGPNAVREAQLAQEAVLAAASQVSGSVQAAAISRQVAVRLGLFESSGAPQADEYFAQAYDRAEEIWRDGAPVLVDASQVSRIENLEDKIPDGLDQSSPGMLVMFVMFFIIGGGVALIQEREAGTLRRLVVMPMHKGAILAGKFLGIFLTGLLQMVILIVGGAVLFGVSWGQSPLALTAVTVSFGFAISSLSLMMAALVRTSAQANALTTAGVMALGPLSGAWWPLDIVPGWMRTFAHGFPSTWAMDGFNDIITRGLDLDAVMLETAVLCGFGLLFLAVALWRFRYE